MKTAFTLHLTPQAELKIRRTFGTVKPVSRVHKSKKDYNRHDKSWKHWD